MTLTAPQPTAPESGSESKDSSRRGVLRKILPILTALIGIAILVYPVLATRHNDAEQQERANQYSVEVQHTGKERLEAELADAEEYNRQLIEGLIMDPFLEDVVPNTPEYQRYLKQLDASDAMGQIKIPAIGVNLPIYHGTDDETLKKGVGHLFSTSLPVGGTGSHSVLTAHTGIPDATLFNDLPKLKKGDVFYLNTAGRKMKYEVSDTQVVLPTDIGKLGRQPGKDLVTLVTCTPYGINSHRLLVTGHRVALDPEEAEKVDAQQYSQPWTWWMIALLAGAALALLLLAALALRLWLAARRRQNDRTDPTE